MFTSTRRFGATHTGHPQPVGVALALLACVGLTACTVAAPPPPSSAPAPTAAPFPEGQVGALEPLEPGTYFVTGFTVPFEITVPDGWESFGWGVVRREATEWLVAVNFLDPTHVPTDACKWRGTLEKVDPSPEAFADAMAAQTSTATTPPVEVKVGGYSGLEFDYSIESDVDITECDESHICLWSEGPDNCSRWAEAVTEHETERVLDLNGELAQFAVGEFKPVDPALTKEARVVFDSIAFTSGER
jgi:hypothetical protein